MCVYVYVFVFNLIRVFGEYVSYDFTIHTRRLRNVYNCSNNNNSKTAQKRLWALINYRKQPKPCRRYQDTFDIPDLKTRSKICIYFYMMMTVCECVCVCVNK